MIRRPLILTLVLGCLALLAVSLPVFACPPVARQAAACYPQQQAYYAPVQAQILAYPVALQFAVPTVTLPVQVQQPPPQPVPASAPVQVPQQEVMQQPQYQPAAAPVIVQRQVQAYYAAPAVALAPVAIANYAVGSYGGYAAAAAVHVPVRQRVIVRQRHAPVRVQALRQRGNVRHGPVAALFARVQANRAARVAVPPRIAVAAPRTTVIVH